MGNKKNKISSFSVLLIMGAMMVVGAAIIPLLSVQYSPVRNPKDINVVYSWPGASAKLVEQEVTAKIEGVLARIEGVSSIGSASRKGGGNVHLGFKKGTKMDVARFEVASQIRYLYPSLPAGVSYPNLSLSVTGSNESPILTYTINSALPPDRIGEYIKTNILSPLSRIEGVNSVDISGITPFEYEITFDAAKAAVYGISSYDISTAFQDYFRQDAVGNVTMGDGNTILLRIANAAGTDFDDIPVKKSGDKIIYLGELATVRYLETLPTSYYRINGLNTVNLSVYAEKNSNLITVASLVRGKMEELGTSFPAGLSARISYDSSEYIQEELHKIFVRTALTLLILLAFVFLVSRNVNYLLIIFSTLAANILIALIFYYLFKINIHIYSLAGITVSLGIIIDTSIIMTDHYSHYRDRRIFSAILGALLTTVAALTIIFFLPEAQQESLADFAAVIIINLIISLFVAFMFIPSLLERLPLKRRMTALKYKAKRRTVCFDRFYGYFIRWGRRHRWIFIILLILGFGIPLHLLPSKITQKDETNPTRWVEIYNKTIGGRFYQNNKQLFEKTLGGSLRLFTSSTSGYGFYREPARKQLTINAGMPEGCTVHQLNEIVKYMENYLSRFDQIEMFQTSVRSYDSATILVTFRPEYENTGFPVMLKSEVIQAVNIYGGAIWGVYGIDDQGFSNNVRSSYKSNRITLTGYNYDMLLRYAEQLADTLRLNRRVSEPGVYGEVNWSVAQNEYFIELDRERIARSDVSAGEYFSYLSQLLFNQPLRPIFVDGRQEAVSLVSGQKNSFDLWNVRNNPLRIDSVEVKLSDIGTITKQPSAINIHKTNQAYQLTVAFDFVGSYELANRVIKQNVDRLNDYVLPIGYKAESPSYGWGGEEASKQVWLLLLVITIIYFICAIIFESLLKPLIIIMMIPISFIGVFLTFGLSGWRFDQGGFASFILLCGIVVNAGIYLINEHNIVHMSGIAKNSAKAYLKAYNRKIVPIMLTIISTVLGLIPFVYDGKDEVFWFAFAIGAMGGMIFSIIALIVYLPIFIPFGSKSHSPQNVDPCSIV